MEERRDESGGEIDVTVYPWGVYESGAISVEKSWRLNATGAFYRPSRIALNASGMRLPSEYEAYSKALERAAEIAAELDALHPEGTEYVS